MPRYRVIHVLIIPWSYPSPANPLSGIFFREQAQALRKRGLQVGVASPDPRALNGAALNDLFGNLLRIRLEDDSGIPTYRSTFPAVPKSPRARKALWLNQLRRLVDRYVAEQGVPDVVHAHGILWAGVGAVRARFPSPVPVVVTAHSSAFARGLIRRWQEPAIAEALHGADAVLAVSSALRQRLARYAPTVAITAVPNMVDTDFFSPADRSGREEFTWLSVASLTENKGIHTLLSAFAGAFAGNRTVRLRIAGDGPERSQLVALAARLDLTDRVQFVGRLDRPGVRREMHDADAFVLSSRVETFGVALIEAMATGLPVVATRSGGPEDVVYSDVGYLVAPDDPLVLADAMGELFAQRERWRQRGPGIRSYVDEQYSERAVTDLIIETYQQVIDT